MSASNQVGAFNYAVPPFGNLPLKNITAAYLVSPSDNNFIINCTTGTFTVSLQPAASLPIGFNVTIWNTGPGSITIDPNGVETIDGIATLNLRNGEGTQIVCDGSNWQTGSQKEIRSFATSIANSLDRPVASGSASIAIGAGTGGTTTTASGIRNVAIGWQAQATGDYQTVLGVNSAGNGAQAITGNGAMALGGSYASGVDSFAAAIANNTSTYGAKGANSVVIGQTSVASGSVSMAIGRLGSATGVGSVAIGYGFSSANSSLAISGNSGTPRAIATSDNAVAIMNGNASQVGKYAFTGNYYSASSDIQTGTIVLFNATTNATATILRSNGVAADSTNQVILPNSSAYAFTGTVVARQSAAGGTASAAWKVEGLIRREANAASTTLVFSLVTAISNVPLWTLALSADTTNGGLAVTATGAAATNILWCATIQTSECTYA